MPQGNVIRVSSGFIGRLFSLLFSKGFFYLFGTILILFSATMSGLQAHSWTPFFTGVGNNIVKVDQNIYDKASLIEKNGGVPIQVETPHGTWASRWASFKTLLSILGSILMLIWLIFVIYNIMLFFRFVDHGNVLGPLLFITCILVIFQAMTWGIYGLQEGETALNKLTPYRGVIKLAMVSPLLFKTVSQNTVVQSALAIKNMDVGNQTTPSECPYDVCY